VRRLALEIVLHDENGDWNEVLVGIIHKLLRGDADMQCRALTAMMPALRVGKATLASVREITDEHFAGKVQHCSMHTDYRVIKHQNFTPETCKYCFKFLEEVGDRITAVIALREIERQMNGD
jgi:hypothetical protein